MKQNADPLNETADTTKKQRVFWLIPLILFLAFVIYMMVRSIPGGVSETLIQTPVSVQGLASLSDTFEEVLQEDIHDKNEYINLNGLTTRVLGIHSLNERQKLANGYLADFADIRNTDYAISGVIELNNFLSDRGIPFAYILSPDKASFYDAEFAPGYSSNAWENLDTVFTALNEAGVNTIDIDAWCEENGWSMEDAFFKTDHHWLPQTAMQAARLTMELLSEQGLVDYDSEKLDNKNWNVLFLKDLFLGSDGKRTGTLYAGVDDFYAYFPEFPTDYTYSYVSTGTTNWTYLDSPVDTTYLERVDYFSDDGAYAFYLHGNKPIRRITNLEANSDKKLLVIGDSFSRPYEYFLSTQFVEVNAIDPRNYSDGTLAEYIEEIDPDIVLMCSSENDLSNAALYTTGISDYNDALDKTDKNTVVEDLGNCSVKSQADNQDNDTVLRVDLKPGQTYTMTAESTFYSGGEDLYIQMTLQNLTDDEAVYNRYFDANSDEIQKWIFTVPEGEDTYAIYLYAGTRGHTAGVSAEVKGVTLRKGIFEDWQTGTAGAQPQGEY